MKDIYLIDAHSHLIWPQLFENITEIVSSAKNHNIKYSINCGIQNSDFEDCIKLKESFPDFVHNIIGIHPEVSLDPDNSLKKFKEKFLKHANYFKAIGEIGLDYYEFKDKGIRRALFEPFRDQLDFAKELDLPVVIHARDAEKHAINLLEEPQYSDISKVLMHCYSGPEMYLKKCLEHDNWFFTIPTSVCYKPSLQNLAKIIPLEKLMLETDAPFLTPFENPTAEQKLNKPEYIIKSAKKLAELKGLEFKEITNITTKNSEVFFNIEE